MSIKISVNNDKELQLELKKISKELRLGIEGSTDKRLNEDIEELKSQLFNIINSDITIGNKNPEINKNLPPSLNISKSKNDILKEIFGADITNSDFLRKNLKNNVLDDKSNVFIMKDGRIKAWQGVSESSEYNSQEQFFRNRLVEGIIVDADTGKMYKPSQDTIKGIKLECSRDTGETLNSSKKFDAYKNSTKITRRKEGSPYDRIAVWTLKQDDLKLMLKQSLSVDDVVNKIMEGDYESASFILNKMNVSGNFKKPIENLENFKSGKIVSPEAASYKNIQLLIKNLKIRKLIDKYKTTYKLITYYDRELEQNQEEFFDNLRTQIYLWLVSNETKWFDSISKAVEQVLSKYKT